jgi:ribosomal protection tetracycline resistance protein
MKVPTLIFVNKMDRTGADFERTLAAMRRRLSSGVVSAGGADLPEILAEHNDSILRAFVAEDGSLSDRGLRAELARQTRRGLVHPVFCGSAAKGVGTDDVLAGIRKLLAGRSADPAAPVSGRVFKIERSTSGERVAYVRLFAGSLRPRQRVKVGAGEEAKPTSIGVFAPAGAPRRDVLMAGEMATVRGLGAVRVGDAVGEPPPGQSAVAQFPRPTLEAVVFAVRPEQQGSLRAALTQLAEQDPLIDVRQDERQNIYVSLYGEVQKEVIQATLERDYGIAADFRETSVVCIERPARVGEAEELLHAQTHTNITGRSSPFSTNPFAATLGIRIEPLPFGTGVEFRLAIEPRFVPLNIFKTNEAFAEHMEAYVREALAEGLAGWQVTDCRVTVTDCGYYRTGSTAGDFRLLTQLVVAEALERAGTWVCEPMADISLEMPASTAPAVLALVGRQGGRVRGQFTAGELTRAQVLIQVANVRPVQYQLPGLSMGEGPLGIAARRLPAGRREPAETSPFESEPTRARGLAGLAVEARVVGRINLRRWTLWVPWSWRGSSTPT